MKNKNNADPTLAGQLKQYQNQLAHKSAPVKNEYNVHYNLYTGWVYRKYNADILNLASFQNGYTQKQWVTINQVRQMGGRVKPGEAATFIRRGGVSNYTGDYEFSSVGLFNIEQIEFQPLSATTTPNNDSRVQASLQHDIEDDNWLADFTEELLVASEVKLIYSPNPVIYGARDKNAICLPNNFNPKSPKASMDVIGELVKLQRSQNFMQELKSNALTEPQILDMLAEMGTIFLLSIYRGGVDNANYNKTRRSWPAITRLGPDAFVSISTEAHRCSNQLAAKLDAFENNGR